MNGKSNFTLNLNYSFTVFPGSPVVKNPPANVRDAGDWDLWVGKISWNKKWQPTPAFLPGESHGQRSLAGYSP